MSVHQPYPPQFIQFRTVYTTPTVRPYRQWGAPTYGFPGGANRNQNGSFPFYSGYTYYLSPYQHPVIIHQASAAASNWFLDAVGKMPWHHIIPTWVELIRMGLRSAQDQVTTRLSKWRLKRPREESLRNAAEPLMQGVRHWV